MQICRLAFDGSQSTHGTENPVKTPILVTKIGNEEGKLDSSSRFPGGFIVQMKASSDEGNLYSTSSGLLSDALLSRCKSNE
jgi:hypothetical protein